MAPSARRRAGRTLRRPRRRSTVNDCVTTCSTSGSAPLQAIGENTVVDLTVDGALDEIASIFRVGIPITTLTSRSPQKQSKKTIRKKRQRNSTVFCLKRKRKEELKTLLNELETQVQEKCDEIVADAERRAQELEMELKVQLLFLPEAVRQMAWKTFVEDFGGDLRNVIHCLSQSQTLTQMSPLPLRTQSCVTQHDIVATTLDDHRETEHKDGPQSMHSDHDTWKHRMSAFSTPKDRHRAGIIPTTVLRTARKGETTYSARGSPIVPVIVAEAKAPTGSLVTTFEKGLEPTSCCIQLDSERVLDLSRPEMLSAKSRGEATLKLKALQAKVAQLLLHINSCSD